MKSKLVSNCAWCIYAPVINLLQVFRIYHFECFHDNLVYHQRYNVSRKQIYIAVVVLLIYFYYLLYFIWSLIDILKQSKSSNEMKIYLAYSLLSFGTFATLTIATFKSKYRMYQVRGLSIILKSKRFGLNLLHWSDAKKLRKKSEMLGRCIKLLTVLLITLYCTEIVFNENVPHTVRIFLAMTYWFIHCNMSEIFISLSLSIKIYRNAIAQIKKLMSKRLEHYYCKELLFLNLKDIQTIDVIINKFIIFHGYYILDIKNFMKYFSAMIVAMISFFIPFGSLIASIVITKLVGYWKLHDYEKLDILILCISSMGSYYFMMFNMRYSDLYSHLVSFKQNIMLHFTLNSVVPG